MRNTIMKNKQINIMLSIYMSCAAVTIYLLNYYTPLYRNGLKINFSNTEQLQFFWKAFEEGNTEGIEKYLNRVLSNSVSVFDTKARNEEKESSYHNLLVGILTGNADWLIKSNIEAGEGFADIIAETDDPDSGIIVKLKYTKEFDEMEQACQKAIAQIKNRRYYEYLLNDDRRNILFYGIAFCKKRCKIIVERMNM